MAADFSHSLRALREDGFRRPGRALVVLALLGVRLARVVRLRARHRVRGLPGRAARGGAGRCSRWRPGWTGASSRAAWTSAGRSRRARCSSKLDFQCPAAEAPGGQARLDTLLPQLETLKSELAAQQKALEAEGLASGSGLSEARARQRRPRPRWPTPTRSSPGSHRWRKARRLESWSTSR